MNEHVSQFIDDLESRIDFWGRESELTVVEALGGLDIIKANVQRKFFEGHYDEQKESENAG